MDLLSNRAEDEAYLAADPGKAYVLYFTDGGAVDLDLKSHPDKFDLRWVNISTGEWGPRATLTGGKDTPVKAPGKGGWVATIVRQ